jgi:hypothetical protein
MKPVLAVFLFPLLFIGYAYAEPTVMEQVTSDGSVKVQLSWPEVLPDQLYDIGIRFLDPETGQVMDNASVVYDVAVLQGDAIIEIYSEQSTGDGNGTFEVVFPEDATGSAEVIIGVVSVTSDAGTVAVNEEVSFNVQVVPEFETLAAMVMAISIGALVTLTRFKNTKYNIN